MKVKDVSINIPTYHDDDEVTWTKTTGVELELPDDFIRQIVDERIEARVLPSARGITGDECLAKLDRGRVSSANFPEPEERSCEMYNENALWGAWINSKSGGPKEYKQFQKWLVSIKGEKYYTVPLEQPKPIPRDTPPDVGIQRWQLFSDGLEKRDNGWLVSFTDHESAIAALKAQKEKENKEFENLWSWYQKVVEERNEFRKQLTEALTALLTTKAQQWTDEDMIQAWGYGVGHEYENARGTPHQFESCYAWLASHRKQKTAFDPGKEAGGTD